MGKIVFKHVQLNQKDLEPFANLVYRRVFENPTYPKLQTLVMDLKPLTDVFSTTLIDAKDGGKDRTKVKDLAKDALKSHLTKLGMTIELESDGNEDYITNTGFPVRQPPIKKILDYVDVPESFTIKNDDKRKGVLNFSWKKPNYATNCIIEELVSEGVWKRVASSTAASVQLTDLTPNMTKTYRIYALGTGNLVSDYSDVVTITVNP